MLFNFGFVNTLLSEVWQGFDVIDGGRICMVEQIWLEGDAHALSCGKSMMCF